MDTIVQAVRQHANAHYGDPGVAWDVLVECWSDDDIADTIGRKSLKTPKQAIAIVEGTLRTIASYRDDIVNS